MKHILGIILFQLTQNKKMEQKTYMTQKQLSKKYKFLHGKQFNCYFGRVPCKYKHIEYGLSLYPKSNCYGDFKLITLIISKTSYNGRVLEIFPKYIPCDHVINQFKINNSEIDYLITLIQYYEN